MRKKGCQCCTSKKVFTSPNREGITPSLLYTDGTENVKKETEKELEIPDPDSEVANAAILKNIIEEDSNPSSEN